MQKDDILKFHTIAEYNKYYNHETLHPLISVIDFSKADPRFLRRMSNNFYTIFLKKVFCGDLRYGMDYYDYEEGTLVFLAPGQVIGENLEEHFQPQGLGLVFHPDLIHGTPLGSHMSDYHFFSYAVNEALHLSEYERQIVSDSFAKIAFELSHGIDKHSKMLIVSTIELFLNYCIRFYDRQFITRENVNKGILEKFDDLLKNYFESDKPDTIGIPHVSYCAEQLNLSANYFGDLIKKETGRSAQEYIQSTVINLAKEKLFDQSKSVSEIAYGLGFKYPQHFSRLFKQHVGKTPNEYRVLN